MKLLHLNSYYAKRNFYKNLYDLQLKQGIDIKVYTPYNKKNIAIMI